MKNIKLKTMIALSIVIITLLFAIRPIIEKSLDKIDVYGKGYVVNFIDDEGVRIAFKDYPKRIISLDSVHTENIFSLELENNVIAVDAESTMPYQAAYKPGIKLGDKVEELISLSPDVVIITPEISREYDEFVKDVRRAGLNVVSLSYPSIEDVDIYFSRLGQVCGKPKTSKIYAESFVRRVDELKKNDNKFEYFVESSEYGLTSYLDNSYPIKQLNNIGGRSVVKGKPLYENSSRSDVSSEINDIKDIDVYVTVSGRGGNEHTIKARKEFEETQAIIKDNIIEIPVNYLFPTESYFKGTKELDRLIFPKEYDDYITLDGNVLDKRIASKMAVIFLNKPFYKPSRSQILEEYPHGYGKFIDVKYDDGDFDYIETAVNMGVVSGEIIDGDEYFYPDNKITRYELAKILFMVGDIKDGQNQRAILDIDSYRDKSIVKAVVNGDIIKLVDGRFNGHDVVTIKQAKMAFRRLKKQGGSL